MRKRREHCFLTKTVKKILFMFAKKMFSLSLQPRRKDPAFTMMKNFIFLSLL
jgi:hypothetical protein